MPSQPSRSRRFPSVGAGHAARVAAAAAGALTLAVACSAASPPIAPSPGQAVTLVPARATTAGPAVALHAHPFGVPAQLRAGLSAVVRDLFIYQPAPALPGSAGTPVAADVFITAPPRAATPRTITSVMLTDPATGRGCQPAPGAATTRVTSAPGDPDRTVLHQIDFICPEQVRTNLLVTLRNGPNTLTFYGPLA